MSPIDKSMKISSSKDKINISRPMVGIPDIKLIRTDTTLDLSQKAEKNARRRQSSKTASRRRRQGQTCGTEAYAHPETAAGAPNAKGLRRAPPPRSPRPHPHVRYAARRTSVSAPSHAAAAPRPTGGQASPAATPHNDAETRRDTQHSGAPAKMISAARRAF